MDLPVSMMIILPSHLETIFWRKKKRKKLVIDAFLFQKSKELA